MSKEWKKFQSEYKKQQPSIKKLPLSGATKLHAGLKKTLIKSWDQEDKIREALSKAQEDGIKSEKLADFMKNKEVQPPNNDVVKLPDALSKHAVKMKKVKDAIGKLTTPEINL